MIEEYLNCCQDALDHIKYDQIEAVVNYIAQLRSNGGRLFILGVGGSAANASHAVNDFRKLCNVEAYAPTDNVSELTARINDDGWDSCYANWLRGCRLNSSDGILVLSVGGGDMAKKVSMNLVEALNFANSVCCPILGIVGPNGGYTKFMANECITIEVTNREFVTPITEAFQAVVWHLIVSHPLLKETPTTW